MIDNDNVTDISTDAPRKTSAAYLSRETPPARSSKVAEFKDYTDCALPRDSNTPELRNSP